VFGACPERSLEADAVRQIEILHRFSDTPHDEIGEYILGEIQQIAKPRCNDTLNSRLANDFFQRVGKVLEDNDALGARVSQLKLPHIATGYCRMFGSMMATRSPRVSPSVFCR